jgi:hypothetical protein
VFANVVVAVVKDRHIMQLHNNKVFKPRTIEEGFLLCVFPEEQEMNT